MWIESTSEEKINQGIYNRFSGSLEYLKNLSKLTDLNISNTDIDSGLEYLPESVKHFWCSADLRKDARCKGFMIYLLTTKEK